MTTRLAIVHRTGYTYAGGAVSSYNEARMTPLASAEQRVLASQVTINPDPWQSSYVDYWGTLVTAFEVHERHDRLAVEATSTVEVTREPCRGAGLTWDQIRGRRVADELGELLVVAERVAPAPDLLDRVRSLAAAAPTPRALVHDVVELIHDEVKYVVGSTGVHSHASEAWDVRAGVCQDMAHLVIGSLRAVGVPARYVSGYLLPSTSQDVGATYVGESHAWVHYWDGAWQGCDPTNAVDPADHHVEVAHGRDYADVSPLRGIFTGGATSDMFVEVEMTILADSGRSGGSAPAGVGRIGLAVIGAAD